MKNIKLRKDLVAAGADSKEAEALAEFAKTLTVLRPHGLTSEAKKRLAPSRHAAKPIHPIRWSLVGGLATACLLLVIAQGAMPGSWLYRVKRSGEEAKALVKPSYVDDLVEKRRDEVEVLEKQQADPVIIEEANKNYEKAVERSNDRWYKWFETQKRRRSTDQSSPNDTQESESDSTTSNKETELDREIDQRFQGWRW